MFQHLQDGSQLGFLVVGPQPVLHLGFVQQAGREQVADPADVPVRKRHFLHHDAVAQADAFAEQLFGKMLCGQSVGIFGIQQETLQLFGGDGEVLLQHALVEHHLHEMVLLVPVSVLVTLPRFLLNQ